MTSATSDDRTVGEQPFLATGSPDPHDEATPDAHLWNAAADLFLAWRRGDGAGLDGLVRLLTPVLWQVTRAYGLDRSAAEDVVQNTWLALVRSPGSIRDPQAVFRWLTTTARRDAWRRAKRSRQEDAVEPEVIEAAVAPAADGPERQLLAGVAARSLWRLVSRLSERCQRLLRVIAFDDRPNYGSLSAELGMAVGAIGPTRMRCLQKLRDLMAADPEWAGA